MITSNAKGLVRSAEPNAKTARISRGNDRRMAAGAVFSDRVVLRKGQLTQELPLIRPQKPMGPHARQSGAARQNAQPIGQPAMAPKPGVPHRQWFLRRHQIMDKGSIFMKKVSSTLACALLALLLGACATAPADQNVQDSAEPAAPTAGEALRLTSAPLPSAARPPFADQDSAATTAGTTMILPGTGNFIDRKTTSSRHR